MISLVVVAECERTCYPHAPMACASVRPCVHSFGVGVAEDSARASFFPSLSLSLALAHVFHPFVVVVVVVAVRALLSSHDVR